MNAGFTLRQDKSIYIATYTVQCTVTWEIYTDTEQAFSERQREDKDAGEMPRFKAWIMKDEEICAVHPLHS